MFPVALDQMMRMCGAQTNALIAKGSNVKINNQTPAVVGDIDNHNMLGQLINVLPHNVNIGGIPAIPSIVSMASPDVLGLTPHPQGLPIPIQGSPNVFIGQGAGAAGIGMMQQLGLGSFGALGIGELVSVAGQVIGMVQNFTQLGGGAAVAQLNNLQGTPITPGTTVVGQTSGYKFTFANYIDSRTYDNVVGGASYNSANSYPSVDSIANAITISSDSPYDFVMGDNADYYVMEDGAFLVLSDPIASNDYLVIDDYISMSPTLNLTASVITA